jgi:hypothetical protein
MTTLVAGEPPILANGMVKVNVVPGSAWTDAAPSTRSVTGSVAPTRGDVPPAPPVATPTIWGPLVTTTQASPVSDCGPLAEGAVVVAVRTTEMFVPTGTPAVETATATVIDPPGGRVGETVLPTEAGSGVAPAGVNVTLWTLPALTVSAEMTYASLMFESLVIVNVRTAMAPPATASVAGLGADCFGVTNAPAIAASDTDAVFDVTPYARPLLSAYVPSTLLTMVVALTELTAIATPHPTIVPVTPTVI